MTKGIGVHGRELLLVGLGEQAAADVEASVAPMEALVSAVPDAPRAAAATASRLFDALVVSHGPGVSGLVRAVRGHGSPCRRAGLVLLTSAARRSEAEAFVGNGVNRVLIEEELRFRLAGELDRLFRVAPRLAVKAAVRVHVDSATFSRRFLCETVNLSATGMLLRASNSFPVDTAVRFELFPPAGGATILGEGRVVRATRQGREPYPGFGVHILDAEVRYRDWLEVHAARGD